MEGSGDHGVVIFSLSSSFSTLDAAQGNKITAALARLPQRVLWKFEGEPPSTLGNNTKLVKWLPMNDLLGEYLSGLDRSESLYPTLFSVMHLYGFT